MIALTILLVLGICVFLIWFFEAIMKDCSDESSCIDLRLERRISEKPYTAEHIMADHPYSKVS
ncbi:MAG: hypothetical protein WCG21_04165 [Eubacteriales bacterium]